MSDHNALASPKRKKRKVEDTPEKSLFSAPEFLKQLSQTSTAFIALEKFTSQAEQFADDSGYDIVGEFCKTSKDGSEILIVLEQGKRKSTEYHLIFCALEHVLLRIADDLPQYRQTGEVIVQRILTNCMGSVYHQLSMRNKAAHIKSCLRLLIAMVMTTPTCARDVFLQFDFTNSAGDVYALFYRRDLKDQRDVRCCVLLFVMAFLVGGDNWLVKQIVDQKFLLQAVFKDMGVDKAGSILSVLPIILDKVVKNESLSKTAKVKLFNETALHQVCQLFRWNGPVKWSSGKPGPNRSWSKSGHSLDQGDPQEEVDGEMTADRTAVVEMAQTFITELCSVQKTGIIFYDKSYGTVRNINPLIRSVLNDLSNGLSLPAVEEVVVSILEACPDQLNGFVTRLKSSLTPRPSSVWRARILFLCKIYSAVNCVTLLNKLETSVNVSPLKVVASLILPPVMADLKLGLKNTSMAVRDGVIGVVQVVLRQAVVVLNTWTEVCKENNRQESEILDFQYGLRDLLSKGLPSLEVITNVWKMSTNKVSSEESETKAVSDKSSEDAPEVDVIKHRLKLGETLHLYNEVFPREVTTEMVAEWLESVNKQLSVHQASQTKDQETVNKLQTLQLSLVKVLCMTESEVAPWKKMGSSGYSVYGLLLEMLTDFTQDATTTSMVHSLITKTLEKSGFFESEIPIWLKHIETSSEDNRPIVVKLFDNVLTTFLANPHPLMDKVANIMSNEAADSDLEIETSGGATVEGAMDGDMDVEDVDAMMEQAAVVSLPDTKTQPIRQRYPFTPLVIVALDKLEKDNEGCVEYVSRVLLGILHSQSDPVPLCRLIQRSGVCLTHSPLLSYLLSWLPENKKDMTTSGWSDYEVDIPEGEQLCFELMRLRCTGQDGNRLTVIRGLIDRLEADSILAYVQQLLLYIHSLIGQIINCGKFSEKKASEKERELVMYFNLLEEVLKRAKALLTTEANNNVSEPFFMIVDRALCKILETPLLQQFFLATFGERKLPKVVGPMLSGVVSQRISSLFMDVCTKCSSSLSSLVQVFVDKVSKSVLKGVQQLKSSSSQRSTMGVEENHQIALTAFIGHFPTGNLLDLTEKLLNDEEILDDVEGLSKSVVHGFENVICKILEKLCELDLSNCLLSENCVHKLFLYLEKFHGKNYRNVHCENCLRLVKKCPRYASQATTRTMEFLTRISSKAATDLAAMFVSQNSSLRTDFMTLMTIEQPEEKLDKILGVWLACVHSAAIMGETENIDVLRKKFWGPLSTWLINLGRVSLTEKICEKATLWFILLHSSNPKSLEDLYKKLQKRLLEENKHVHVFHLQTLKICCDKLEDSASARIKESFLLTCLKILLKVLQSQRDNSAEVLDLLLTVLREQLEHAQIEDNLRKGTLAVWPNLVKCTLKWSYCDHRALRVVERLVTLLYTDQDTTPTLQHLHAMLTNHTKFLPVMFDEESKEVKASLVGLLLTIVERCEEVRLPAHIPVIRGAYTATLSNTDQMLLKILILYKYTASSDFRSCLWGAKARDYYQPANKGKSLSTSLSTAQVIALLDKERLLTSTLRFPLRRSLLPGEIVSASEVKSEAECYDPCFLLPLFAHLLRSENLVDCSQFVESGCLGYVFSALSSHDGDLRSLAYLTLTLYYRHAEAAKFTGKDQVMCLLDTVRHSLVKPNTKLACVVSLFLAKALVAFTKPESHMFQMVNAFLLLKPDMDLLNVPEFFTFFNSSALEYKQERGWILELLSTSLRETADYRLYEKRFVFKLILTFYSCPLSDNWCKLQILKVLIAAFKEKTVTFDLVENHGILAWISAVVKSSCGHTERFRLVTEMMEEMWRTISPSVRASPTKFQPLCHSILTVLQALVSQIREGTPVSSVLRCIKTLTDVQESVQEPDVTAMFLRVATMLQYHCTVIREEENGHKIRKALEMAGFEGTIISVDKKKGQQTDRRKEKEPKSSEEGGTINDTSMPIDDNQPSTTFLDELVRFVLTWRPFCAENQQSLLVTDSMATVATVVLNTCLKDYCGRDVFGEDVGKFFKWVENCLSGNTPFSNCLKEKLLPQSTERKSSGNIVSYLDTIKVKLCSPVIVTENNVCVGPLLYTDLITAFSNITSILQDR